MAFILVLERALIRLALLSVPFLRETAFSNCICIPFHLTYDAMGGMCTSHLNWLYHVLCQRGHTSNVPKLSCHSSCPKQSLSRNLIISSEFFSVKYNAFYNIGIEHDILIPFT